MIRYDTIIDEDGTPHRLLIIAGFGYALFIEPKYLMFTFAKVSIKKETE